MAALELAGARGAFTFPFHEPDGYPAANDDVLAAARDSDGLLVPFCRVNPHDSPVPEAERSLDERRQGDQASPARRAVHARPPEGPLARRARRRALAAGPDPRRPRHPRARPARRPAGRGVPERPADPRPRRDLRPVLDLARRRRSAEPAVRHRVVDPGRPPGAVLARAAGADRVRQRRPLRQHVISAAFQLRWPLQLGFSPTRSARSPPSSRCGSPPASRSSRPARRSESVIGHRICCSTGSSSSCCSARWGRCAASTRPRCSRSRGWPATSPRRSTTRPCSRRSARCSTAMTRTRPRIPTSAGGSRS